MCGWIPLLSLSLSFPDSHCASISLYVSLFLFLSPLRAVVGLPRMFRDGRHCMGVLFSRSRFGSNCFLPFVWLAS